MIAAALVVTLLVVLAVLGQTQARLVAVTAQRDEAIALGRRAVSIGDTLDAQLVKLTAEHAAELAARDAAALHRANLAHAAYQQQFYVLSLANGLWVSSIGCNEPTQAEARA